MNPKAKNLFISFSSECYYAGKNPVMSYNEATNEIKIYDDIKVAQKLYEPRNKADFQREGYRGIHEACLTGETACGFFWAYLLNTIGDHDG